jgi:hypothetical protein
MADHSSENPAKRPLEDTDETGDAKRRKLGESEAESSSNNLHPVTPDKDVNEAFSSETQEKVEVDEAEPFLEFELTIKKGDGVTVELKLLHFGTKDHLHQIVQFLKNRIK